MLANIPFRWKQTRSFGPLEGRVFLGSVSGTRIGARKQKLGQAGNGKEI